MGCFFSSKVSPRKLIFGVPPARSDGGTLTFWRREMDVPLPKIVPIWRISKTTRKADTSLLVASVRRRSTASWRFSRVACVGQQ